MKGALRLLSLMMVVSTVPGLAHEEKELAFPGWFSNRLTETAPSRSRYCLTAAPESTATVRERLKVSTYLPGQMNHSALPTPGDNAALHYWKAVALLPQPKAQQEVEAIAFIEGDLQRLPPEALADHETAQALLEQQELALLALGEGAARPVCNFDLAYDQGAHLLLPHLGQMRRLARHALASAKLHQLRGGQAQASAVYGHLLRLAAHLDQDSMIISGLVSAAITQMTLSEIEGLLARAPDAGATRSLLQTLGELPAAFFHPDRYVRLEARVFGDWILRHLDDKEQVMEALGMPGGGTVPPHLQGLSEETLNEMAAAWIRDYRQRMEELADALALPYWQGKARVQEAMRQVGIDATGTEPGQGNPLVAALMPAVDRMQDIFATARARLGMARLTCAAVLFQADHAAYPTRLEMLAEFFPAGLPQDPFTGGDYTYRLEDGLPYIACTPPEELQQRRKPEEFFLGLAERRAADEAALTEAER